MRKFLYAVITVFFILPIGAMGATSSYYSALCKSTNGMYLNNQCYCSGSTGKKTLEDQCFSTYDGYDFPRLIEHSIPDSYTVACTGTGGTPMQSKEHKKDSHHLEFESCDCPKEKHLVPSENKVFCECDLGYIFQDPFNRSLGCVLENNNLTIGVRILDPNGVTISGVTATYSNQDGIPQTQVTNSGVLNIDDISNTAYVRLEKNGFATAIYSAVDLNTKTSVTMQPVTSDQTDMQAQQSTTVNQEITLDSKGVEDERSDMEQSNISGLTPKKSATLPNNDNTQQKLSESSVNAPQLNELSSDLPPPFEEYEGEESEITTNANNTTVAAGDITIAGKVVAADTNETLPGVSIVRIANNGLQTTTGTTTDADGNFTLPGLNSDERVSISFVGFETFTMKVSDWPANHFTIRLEPATINLPEVTVLPNNDDPCTESGGELRDSGACFCNPDKNLSPAISTNFLHKCKCINDNDYEFDQATKSCKPIPQEEPQEEEKEEVATIPATTPPVITQEQIDAAQQKLTDAQQKLDAAREKQNSLGNRLVNAGASALTGYGAQMIATSMAEQSADSAAESDMREWLDTMKCQYGNSQQFNVGYQDIYLPGGDEISDYATEYKNLAAELKKNKAALGLKAGIESETIYDRSDYDLYSYEPGERQSGENASVSRALMGDDTKWAAQKEESEQNKKIGTGLAIGGAAAGIGGNIAVNPDVRQKITDAFKKN